MQHSEKLKKYLNLSQQTYDLSLNIMSIEFGHKDATADELKEMEDKYNQLEAEQDELYPSVKHEYKQYVDQCWENAFKRQRHTYLNKLKEEALCEADSDTFELVRVSGTFKCVNGNTFSVRNKGVTLTREEYRNLEQAPTTEKEWCELLIKLIDDTNLDIDDGVSVEYLKQIKQHG